MVNRGKDLPGGSVDLIVTAMEDQVHFKRKNEDIICVQEMWSQERCQPWHRDAVTWAQVTLNGTVLK